MSSTPGGTVRGVHTPGSKIVKGVTAPRAMTSELQNRSRLKRMSEHTLRSSEKTWPVGGGWGSMRWGVPRVPQWCREELTSWQTRAPSLLSINSGAFTPALSCDLVKLYRTLQWCLCSFCWKDNSNTSLFLPSGQFRSVWSYDARLAIFLDNRGLLRSRPLCTFSNPSRDVRNIVQSGADCVCCFGNYGEIRYVSLLLPF